MHFAYPPRKSSNPPPFRPRSSRLSQLRRTRLRTVFIVLGALIFGLFFFSGRWGGQHTGPYQEYVPTGSPPVVVVTVVDPFQYSEEYIKSIQDNRDLYAKKHGESDKTPWSLPFGLVIVLLAGGESTNTNELRRV
jgi:mannan polymerase II complex MNN11 subunit